MIDLKVLQDFIHNGVEFWCDTDEQRVALLTALDELGYRWYSNNKLLDMTRADYQVKYGQYNGISYRLMTDIACVTKGRGFEDGMILVSAVLTDVNQSDLLTMLFETEVTA